MLLVLVMALQGPISRALSAPVMQSWMTVFVAVVVQALPFLVLGVLLSAVIAVFVPPSFFARALPRRPALAVPVAGAAGAVLPGCECASVPVAGALVRRGVTPAAALAFLLSAPAINPVVLTATAVAFPGNPEMVSPGSSRACSWRARWAGCGSGWAAPTGCARRPARRFEGQSKGGGVLGIGAARRDARRRLPGGRRDGRGHAQGRGAGRLAAARWPATRWCRSSPWRVLAVLLSICSEADAFVAASLTQFSLTARLAFLVVGPMIDLKLFAMQAGTFGRGFALRFAPATFALAVLVSALVGAVLL